MSAQPQFRLWATQFDSSGRVHMPSELRKEFGAGSGTPVVWVRSPEGLALRRYDEVVGEVQDFFCGLGDTKNDWTGSIQDKRSEESHG